MRKPRHLRHIPLALTIIGGLTITLGIAIDDAIDPSDIRAIGLVAVLAGLGWLGLRRTASPSAAAYELGRREGYEEGKDAGRAISRPVVVPMRLRTGCTECRRRDAASHATGSSAEG